MPDDPEMVKAHSEIVGVPRSKEQAKASYDKISRWYDRLAGWSERRSQIVGLEKLAAREGEKILEIGFGTGHCLVALAEAVGASGRVYGIDISEGMLRIAENRVAKAGHQNSVELKCGDGVSLPYETGLLDAVFMSYVLDLIDTPEIPRLLRECQRVLKARGRICVVAMSKEGHPGGMVRLYEWAHRRFPISVDCRPIYVARSLAQSGFQILETMKMSMFGLPLEIVLAMRGPTLPA